MENNVSTYASIMRIAIQGLAVDRTVQDHTIQGCAHVREDCICNKEMSIPVREDYIGNIVCISVREYYVGNSKVCIPVSKDCIGNKKESDQCELKKKLKLKEVMKLKQEEFEQGRVLEHGKDAQTPLATVSLGSDEISLGSNENSDARPCAMRIRRAQI